MFPSSRISAGQNAGTVSVARSEFRFPERHRGQMNRQQAILSIGEDPDSSRLLKKLLSRSGFEVWSADSAHRALAAVAARPPDLIVADLDMPWVMEICRLIKG